MTTIQLTTFQGEVRTDTRALAKALGIQHASVLRLVKTHRTYFEQLGEVRFETEVPTSKGGQPEKFALLNEDQCYLLLTFSRNTEKTRKLKVDLVKRREFAIHSVMNRDTAVKYRSGRRT